MRSCRRSSNEVTSPKWLIQPAIYCWQPKKPRRFDVKISAFIFAGCIGLLTVSLPLSAHHSLAAEYDNSKPVSIKGKATKMDWVNPHSHLYFDVTTPDGKTEHWIAETPP